ncbi:hypothetical protein CUR21_12400 [Pseudorhodobacter sp. MZDSW-24AT]|nr:hypothetical protein CUR21_12400 [Pseudorhodobacter sp. MZDSW-24AT]
MLLGTSALLSACGGSGGGMVASRAGNAPADQVLASEGSSAEVLAEGATLTASQRTSSGITRDFEAETARLSPDTTAKVSRNESGALTLVAGGSTIVFAPGDLSEDGYGYESEDQEAGIWAWSADSMAEQLDPTRPDASMVFDYYVNAAEGGTGRQGFLVVGTETDAATLSALPTATYTGRSRIRVAPTTGFNSFSEDVSEARGDLEMTANFGAGTVSGAINRLEGRPPQAEDPTRTWSAVPGSLTLERTAISGNGFTGAVRADSGFTSAIGTVAAGSSYSGTFFGVGAGEVGGGLSLQGTAAETGQGYVGWGFFSGQR